MKRLVFRLVVAAIPVLAVAAAADAANDHLACFKVKAPKAFEAASVDLDAMTAGFDLTGCTLKPKALHFCVPVTKTVTSLEEGTPVDIDGDPEAFHRICYKLKCPDFAELDVETTDQFGTRTLTATKPSTLCAPAILGPAPTTTLGCIDADMDTYGANCPAGADCDDTDQDINPAADELCNSVDDNCDGITDDVEQSCYSGPPGTNGVGECQSGIRSCNAGSFGPCLGEVTPQTEICGNGLDEDCDGTPDDGC